MSVRASAGGYAGVIKKLATAAGPDDPTAVKAPIGYGVFSQGLASAQAQAAQDPAYGGAYMHALANNVQNERAYTSAQTSAQALDQFRQTAALKLFDKIDDKGTIQEIDSSALGPYGQVFNPVTIAADAAIRRRIDAATGQKITAEGIAKAREGGVTVDAPTVQNLFSNPVTGAPATGYGLFDGNSTPTEDAATTTADAAMLRARAEMKDVSNPLKYAKSGGSGGGGTTSIVVPIPGVGMATLKGKDTGSLINQAQGIGGHSPQVQSLTAAAARAGGHAVPTSDGGVAITLRGQTKLYNAQGQAVK